MAEKEKEKMIEPQEEQTQVQPEKQPLQFDPTRQSSAKPTAMDQLVMMNNTSGATDGFKALNHAVTRETVQAAMQTLQKYKEGKANLEQRIIENEQWYKMRHWECMRNNDSSSVKPVSGWLFNALANKHADAMDNFPEPNILPREETDKPQAEMLSSIIPVILDQANFEETYSDAWEYKLRSGTGVYGIFWSSEKLNGLGDIEIRSCDLLSLFWESGIKDIQKSRNLFSVELVDNDLLEEQYPQLRGKLGTSTLDVSKYIYDDAVDTTEKSCVVDWYYKKRGQDGRVLLHFCKFVNDEVLFATENEPENYPNGWYAHGLYPFVFSPLFRTAGTPCGFGYVDVAKSAQEYIDRGNQAFMENLLANSKPRHFIRNDGSVNEEEYMDLSKDLVHVDGNLGSDSIMPIQGKGLPDVYINVMLNKVEELKEVTGNRDVSNGGSSGGVTASSAIAAMMEAGSKLSRDHLKASYRAFKLVVNQVIELIRQFYDLPRYFRILGQRGGEQFVMFTNAGLIPQPQGVEFGTDMGYRLPVFDIEVSAQKASPYSKMSQNELALQFYGAGFFNPAMADQALACLDMMDFDHKDMVTTRIMQNAMAYQQLMMAQQMLGGMGAEPMPSGDSVDTQAVEKAENGGVAESKITSDARKRVANSTSPT